MQTARWASVVGPSVPVPRRRVTVEESRHVRDLAVLDLSARCAAKSELPASGVGGAGG
jgi:hypothetical protein